jgi:hypothetical protein
VSKDHEIHRFIDEAGDMTFFKKGKLVATPGENGVSKCFMIGMVKIKQPLAEAQAVITEFCKNIEADPFFNSYPSVQKRIMQGQYYLHASKDPAELRYKFIELLASEELKFSVQIVIGRKSIDRFIRKHNGQEKEFYADLLSHLLKDKSGNEKLILTIAARGSATRNENLEQALNKAHERHKARKGSNFAGAIEFNEQQYSSEPILALVDYALWTVQRIFEKGEVRYYEKIMHKIKHIFDVYDLEKSGPENGWANYYSPENPLTKDNYIHD